jgi:hypothetical protein
MMLVVQLSFAAHSALVQATPIMKVECLTHLVKFHPIVNQVKVRTRKEQL